ncbi:response regulator [Candidatus Oscillochloris fontis]|uniref:response regulator n=1 Tax=Candidatus Oscillochloris fontis TaxID=2496868 RepID=UPI00101BE84E|nr:response regulator [Candidatus Oscillochloris fontis]
MHILIIDDEPDLCWALERMLKADGVTVTAVGSGAAALDFVVQYDVTIAFIDAILPDSHGIHLAQQIHALSPQTRMVMMSGYYYEEDWCRSHVPLVGFLAKPFLRTDVQAMLQHVFADETQQQEAWVWHTSC